MSKSHANKRAESNDQIINCNLIITIRESLMFNYACIVISHRQTDWRYRRFVRKPNIWAKHGDTWLFVKRILTKLAADLDTTEKVISLYLKAEPIQMFIVERTGVIKQKTHGCHVNYPKILIWLLHALPQRPLKQVCQKSLLIDAIKMSQSPIKTSWLVDEYRWSIFNNKNFEYFHSESKVEDSSMMI